MSGTVPPSARRRTAQTSTSCCCCMPRCLPLLCLLLAACPGAWPCSACCLLLPGPRVSVPAFAMQAPCKYAWVAATNGCPCSATVGVPAQAVRARIAVQAATQLQPAPQQHIQTVRAPPPPNAAAAARGGSHSVWPAPPVPACVPAKVSPEGVCCCRVARLCLLLAFLPKYHLTEVPVCVVAVLPGCACCLRSCRIAT